MIFMEFLGNNWPKDIEKSEGHIHVNIFKSKEIPRKLLIRVYNNRLLLVSIYNPIKNLK